MHFSNRLLIFLLPAALPILLYNVASGLLFIGGAYLVLLLIVSVIDYVTNPLFKSVEVRREMNSKFSLGVENIVTLHIVNRSRHPLRLRLKDDFPDALLYEAVLHDCRVSPMDDAQITYRLTPLRRGIYQFADTHLQCWGVLGLIVRRRRVPCCSGDKSLSESAGSPTVRTLSEARDAPPNWA